MKKQINVGLLGMGNVGTGVVKILTNNAEDLLQKTGVSIEIKKIMVRNLEKARTAVTTAEFTANIDDIINDPEIDIVIELMGGLDPAKEYIIRALEAGKHVVTGNKDVVAKYGQEILALAEEKKVDFLFEASVAGGIPIIRPLKQCLAANKITEVMGIINGTTNYMLTKMTTEGLDFNTVLAEAQAKGYAEADPTADVGGFDAARKIAILASIAFGSRVSIDDVYVEGITNITKEDIGYAKELGYIIKLLAIAKDDEEGIDVRVHPVLIPTTHPLAAVNDVFNAVYIKGDAVGETMFYGRGAGQLPTASAVVADVIDVVRNMKYNANGRILCTCFTDKPFCPPEKVQSRYYIRLLVEDMPGVLATIAGAFGAHQVSLHSVIQKSKVKSCSELVLIAKNVADSRLRLAIDILNKLPVVNKVCNVIRVESNDADNMD